MIPDRDQLHEAPARSTRPSRRLADGAKPPESGQSLVPMMRLRLAAPDGLVDVTGHRRARRHPPRRRDAIVIGAATRHRDVAPRSDAVRSGCRAVAEAAAGIVPRPPSATAARSAARSPTPIRTATSRPPCSRSTAP